MRTSLRIAATLTIGSMASVAFGQVVLRAMPGERIGGISANANAPIDEPRGSGYIVDPAQYNFEPFEIELSITDVRQGCMGTNATATIDHDSRFTALGAGNTCRGFVGRTSTVGSVNVSDCGAGNSTFAEFGDDIRQVLRIENAPAAGTPIRIVATAEAASGATSTIRVIRPNGGHLLYLNNGQFNSVVNLPNGEYLIRGGITNGNTARSTVGSSSRSASWSIGFWKECPGDLNGDGAVTLDDLAILLSAFGANNQGDIDQNGATDIQDLALLLAAFGTTCTN